MIDAEHAKSLVLHHCEASAQERERYAIYFCALSERGDYWIIRANTEDYVVRGMLEHCVVGVNAYLVNTVTGRIETVGSGQSVEEYLEDEYDVAVAGTMHYVLGPAFAKDDKTAVIRLRQKLACSPRRAVALLSPALSDWLTGTRRILLGAQAILLDEGIATTIRLQESPGSAVPIDYSASYWKPLKSALDRVGET